MFSALRHRTAALALGVCFILPVHASSPKPGDFANTQARHIAYFLSGPHDLSSCRNVLCRLYAPTVSVNGLLQCYLDI